MAADHSPEPDAPGVPEVPDVLGRAATAQPPVPAWGLAAVVAFVALVICGYVASGVAPTWANSNPEGLLALNARIRHLLLAVAGGITWWNYALIAGLRLALAFVVCHLIGRAYSERVLVWFGRYLGYTRESIETLMAGFDKVDWLIVPWFAGSNIVAAISGIRKMHPMRLAVLLTIGIAARLALYWWIGKTFEDQLDGVLDWIAKYQWPLTIGSIVLVFATIGLNFRRGRSFS